jgi:HSP20 family protein
MSLIKFNKRSFPLSTYNMPNWFDMKDVFADDFFDNGKAFPAMNVKENKKGFELELAVPGFSKKEIEISIEENVLHICGEKTTEDVKEEENYARKEFSYNKFDRKLQLPTTVNMTEKVKATFKDGILCLNLVKKEVNKIQPIKRIEIS